MSVEHRARAQQLYEALKRINSVLNIMYPDDVIHGRDVFSLIVQNLNPTDSQYTKFLTLTDEEAREELAELYNIARSKQATRHMRELRRQITNFTNDIDNLDRNIANLTSERSALVESRSKIELELRAMEQGLEF